MEKEEEEEKGEGLMGKKERWGRTRGRRRKKIEEGRGRVRESPSSSSKKFINQTHFSFLPTLTMYQIKNKYFYMITWKIALFALLLFAG